MFRFLFFIVAVLAALYITAVMVGSWFISPMIGILATFLWMCGMSIIIFLLLLMRSTKK